MWPLIMIFTFKRGRNLNNNRNEQKLGHSLSDFHDLDFRHHLKIREKYSLTVKIVQYSPKHRNRNKKLI